jgi:tRNA-specific 2-thiouridylase
LDPSKDQSYFLHRLNQSQLAKTLFPVGELHKTEVRRIASDIGLPNAKKKDSTGICFIGERPFREFLNRYIANASGPIKDARGRTLGTHVGLSFYTLGQRQGLGIGGVKEKGAQRGGGEQFLNQAHLWVSLIVKARKTGLARAKFVTANSSRRVVFCHPKAKSPC